MTLHQAPSGPDKAPAEETFEAVDVPAIQAEIQERRIEHLAPDNLFSREVVREVRSNESAVDASFTSSEDAGPHTTQVVQTTPGRPINLGR